MLIYTSVLRYEVPNKNKVDQYITSYNEKDHVIKNV